MAQRMLLKMDKLDVWFSIYYTASKEKKLQCMIIFPDLAEQRKNLSQICIQE